MSNLAEFSNQGTFAHDNILAGNLQTVTEKRTILSGTGVLSAGAVLAEDSGNSNKLVLVDSDSATASITEPYAVLAHDSDSTDADAEAIVYLGGHLNGAVLTFGGTDTLATHRAALRSIGIFTSTNLGA